ncbi:hypothetical protein N9O54_05350 [Schleiferiaceae bacterium]|nr:hypothetical protein [Schleiferiaceae bacterium]
MGRLQVNLLIVGFGSIGKKHFLAASTLGFNIDVLSKSKIADDGWKVSFVDKVYKRYDLIIICTPSSNHISDLFLYEKYTDRILVEKPLTLGPLLDEDLQKLSSIKSKVYVAYNIRFLPVVKELKSIINEEGLNYVRLEFLDDCRRWYPDKNVNIIYVANPALGGGSLSTNSHELDYMLYISSKQVKFSSTTEFFGTQSESDEVAVVEGELVGEIPFTVKLSIFHKNRVRGGSMRTKMHHYSWNLDEGLIFRDGKVAYQFLTDYAQSYIDQLATVLKDKSTDLATLQDIINSNKINMYL